MKKPKLAGFLRIPLVTLVVLMMVAVGVASAQSPATDGTPAPTPAPVVGVDVPAPDPTPDPVPVSQTVNAAVAEEVVAVAKLITYQGRLLTPGSGVNKPDGTYVMVFRLYNAVAAPVGSALWAETQNVPVANGLFSVALGSVNAFPGNLFSGQDLWLGVQVGGDPELAPRTRITAVAYALYAENAALAAFATDAGNADTLDGIDSTTFATEAEVMPIVRANDGAGSQVDADFLDGLNSTAFARKVVSGVWSSTPVLAPGGTYGLHFQLGNIQTGWILWRIVPREVGAEFTITNYEDRLHQATNFSNQITVQNTGTITSGFDMHYLVIN